MEKQKIKKLVFKIVLLLTGIINFIPVLILFFPSKLTNSYGVIIPDLNFELLLRHRASMFGIIGGLMIYAAIKEKYQNIATLLGLVSMISFIILFFMIGPDINNELTMVMRIDFIATIALILGYVFCEFKSD